MATRAHSTGRAALRTPEAGEVPRPFPPIPNLRPWLEARVEQLLDETERLIGLLDALDGNADEEPNLGWSGGEIETGHYALALSPDLEDEHDGLERDNDTLEWSLGVACSPISLAAARVAS